MVKKYKKTKKRKHRISKPSLLGDEIFLLLKSMGGSPKRARLANLWNEWQEVMGEEFSRAVPLAHRDRTLFLGVEDAMEIQELGMQSNLILERVNEYMEEEYFSHLRISLYIS